MYLLEYLACYAEALFEMKRDGQVGDKEEVRDKETERQRESEQRGIEKRKKKGETNLKKIRWTVVACGMKNAPLREKARSSSSNWTPRCCHKR